MHGNLILSYACISALYCRLYIRFLGPFPDKETEGVLEDLQDGVFAIREFPDKQEYEICLR